MADDCPRLCAGSRDAGLVIERELTQYVHHLMKHLNPASAIPAELDVGAILSHVELEHCVFDQDEYNVLFGQYFRFDVSSQLPYFYRSVQKIFGALCTKLVAAWRGTVVEHLSLTAFDPVLIHGGSDDRSVDALMDTTADFSRPDQQ